MKSVAFIAVDILRKRSGDGSLISTPRQHIRALANSISDPELRAQRIFFGEPPYAFRDKLDKAFDIKQRVSEHFQCDFRSVAFCGSAHLGFSPTKDTSFLAGSSDLDVALIDTSLFQMTWKQLVEYSKAFNDLTVFGSEPAASRKVNDIHVMLAKRGVLHLHNMPRGDIFDKDREFLRRISRDYADMFGEITISFYMNEYAFSWKQDSCIQQILRD